jgi:hypothetical protein
MRRTIAALALCSALCLATTASGSTSGGDVRLSNDGTGSGYVSVYTLATGVPYTDATLNECTRSHGRQNEPAVQVDPRNTQVLLGSSNDYCGVYNDGSDANGAPIPSGPIWMGYYRSQDGGHSFVSSLIPGYPDDTSPYAALSQARTSSAGDPTIAWDNHGRAFFGSESSGDPAATKKTFGDVWVARFQNPAGPDAADTTRDGLQYLGTTVVAKGSSAPNLLGKFNDKDAIEVDRTGGACDGFVYFSYTRFTGNGTDNIYFSRSTDHGATFSNPINLTPSVKAVQDTDIAVTGNGHVYVVYRAFAAKQGHTGDTVQYVKSTNCGLTWSNPTDIVGFEPYDAQDVAGPVAAPPQTGSDDSFTQDADAAGSLARDCGDFAASCQSGYTFFRHTTAPRATADQLDKQHEFVYIVYDPSKPGTEVPTGTTYGSIEPGTGSQEAVFFVRLDGSSGSHTTPVLLDNQAVGHQVFPDISADGGVLHALWWDSRNDLCYSPMRPIGNCADRSTTNSLDVFATSSTNQGAAWTSATKVTDVASNGNFEQFGGRTVPFGGDYLWITSLGSFSYGVWTDWRNTVPGLDLREGTTDTDNDGADVLQCRTKTSSGAITGDTCPRAGGLDQNIYGDLTP